MSVSIAVKERAACFARCAAGFGLLLMVCQAAAAQAPASAGNVSGAAPYLDTTLPIEARVSDLVSRLTAEEKISLLGETEPAVPRLGIRNYHFGNEALHGVVRPGKFTVFPMSIGLGAMWDPEMIHTMATAISDEARGRYNADHGEMEAGGGTHGLYNGLLAFWSPTINMARDPRWGRTGETYGEDPYLTGRLAVAFVRGLQGDDPRYLKVVSTPKHFAVHNEEFDRFQAQANVGQKALHEYYLPAFRAAVVEGGAQSIMTSYNAINGVPSTMNHWLLTDLVHGDWKFTGYVVTDCGAVSNLFRRFHLAKTPEEAAALAINAGVDLECGGVMQKNLGKALEDGLVTQATIDRAIGNVLRTKFKLGLFDPVEMNPYSKISADVIGSPAHQQIALKAAQESMVLLKNAAYNGKPLLPLNRKTVRSIAVVGPLAGKAQLGGYSGEPFHEPIAPLDGLRAEAGSAAIKYVEWAKPEPGKASGSARFAREVEAARTSDVAVVFLGLADNSSGEGQDRPNIDLPADQEALIEAVVAANPRTVVVLVSGGPLTVEWIAAHVPAVVEAWYPGEQGGAAIADVLFGKVNPAGRLPLTFYRSDADLLDIHDYEVAHGRTYQYFRGDVLYPFGFGLSYTHFAYAGLRLDRKSVKGGEGLKATVEVTNRGAVDGDEVVQLYVRPGAPIEGEPIRRLAAFKRVSVAKGKTVTVTLDVAPEAFESWSETANGFATVPGEKTVEIGASSADIRLTAKVTVLGQKN